MTDQSGKAPSAKEAAKDHKKHAKQSPEGVQGSKEDMDLKRKLAQKVNQGSNLEHPVKLGEGMPDLGKATDAEKHKEIAKEESKDEAKDNK